MADDNGGGGGFGWGLIVGAALGFVAGAYLASGPGREQVESLRARTIELTGSARRAASDPGNPIGRAINDGVSAARRRREDLELSFSRIERGIEVEVDTVAPLAAEALPVPRRKPQARANRAELEMQRLLAQEMIRLFVDDFRHHVDAGRQQVRYRMVKYLIS